jgi:very-short-patch-repair endonuclease
MPKAELMLWGYIRRCQMGFRFFRQYGVGPYSLDFYCPALRLAIEIDGDSHFMEGAAERDQRRDRYMANFGIRTIRFTNDEIYCDLYRVLKKLKKMMELRKQT